MKPVLFCSILIAFFSFSCKPKPLDNLKEVALQVEQKKPKRLSRVQIAAETQRVADSVFALAVAEQKQLGGQSTDPGACNFMQFGSLQTFQEKYKGRLQYVSSIAEVSNLQAELAELRKYRNELSETNGSFPATFQTLTDTLLYVRPVGAEVLCPGQEAGNGFWVFRVPKQKLIEVKTVKVKPKPAKGPNW